MAEDDYLAGNPRFNGTAKLVVLSGCSGGGKSSLLAEMARRGYATRPEPGRQIVKEQAYIEGDAVPWGNIPQFVELCVSRGAYLYNTARPTDRCVLFDRSIVDAVASLARLGLPTPAHLRHALQRYRYARVVFMTPPWQELFAADAERRHSFADAVAEYEALLASYPAHGYEVELIPKAGVRERADFLEQRLGDAGVRQAVVGDHAAVVGCVNAAFEGFTAQIGKPPAPLLADYRALIAAGRVHVLEVAGGVAGVLVTEAMADHLFVDVLAVRPALQRRGIGRRLMAFAAQEAHRRGLAEVRLYTHEVMHGALALYRALHYEETERRLEDGYARVYLRMPLAGDR